MTAPLMVSPDLDLDLEAIIGQCVAILGIRGSGKSNTAGVLFEELLKHSYPLSIVDIDGEYFGLKERFEVLVVGTGDGVEIEIDAGSAEEVARISMERNIPVVLDLSGHLAEERSELLQEYLGALWRLAGSLRRPYIIGIEEAHEFIPQGVRSELKDLVSRIALRGRKRGLGAIIVSQRSAKVDKDVLSQAGLLFLHRVVHEADMRVYGELLPWKKAEVKEIVSALETGDCIFVDHETIVPLHVRERETFHAGFTPTLETVVTPALRQVSQAIIEAIERSKGKRGRRSKVQLLEQRVHELEEVLSERQRQITELEDVARTLGYIRVEVPRTAREEALAPVAAREERADTAGGSQWAAAPVEAPSAAILEPPVIDVGGQRERILPPAVHRHIERLVGRVSRGALLHRRLLAFLVAHAPSTYSVEQIAAWTHCPPGVLENDPPREFLEMGMISTERRGGKPHYRSTLKAFAMREFEIFEPDIGGTELHLITSQLRDRLLEAAST
ncbi:MAG: DUF87 domain-containing protein [Candidatus Bipolaricaulota bacterium]|nr:MAG: DUF87 domain-containing protein [Candidatus Bipolaricaulota bacterium]